MDKFVYLLYGAAYEDCIRNAVKDVANAYTFVPFKSEFIRKAHMLHNCRPLNSLVELPLKKPWFDRALRGMDLDREDRIYFLLYESFHLSYSRRFLCFLKEQYPNSKLCFMFLNPVIDLIWGKLQKEADLLDVMITFNKKDAEKYNIIFCEDQPYKLPIYEDPEIPESDVFFIGADKGRLSKLLAIYEKMKIAGLRCDFHIVGVSEENQKYSDDIVYNRKIPYTEVLARVNATKCVLEVLQNNENYLSIRTSEALQYHRKLLTESSIVKKYDFYNPDIIQVFSNPDDIDTEFVHKEVDKELFEKSIPGDAKTFHRFLAEKI